MNAVLLYSFWGSWCTMHFLWPYFPRFGVTLLHKPWGSWNASCMSSHTVMLPPKCQGLALALFRYIMHESCILFILFFLYFKIFFSSVHVELPSPQECVQKKCWIYLILFDMANIARQCLSDISCCVFHLWCSHSSRQSSVSKPLLWTFEIFILLCVCVLRSETCSVQEACLFKENP